MQLAINRDPIFKTHEGEGDTLILLHTDKPFEKLIRNIIMSKMLARSELFDKPK